MPPIQSHAAGHGRPSWTRLPFNRCSCTLDLAGRAADGACTTAAAAELGGQCRRRVSADDVGELNGGVLVETATLSERRPTVDDPVYLPLGRPPSIDHYFRCSDHALIADGRLHDNPDLLFAS